MCLKNRLSWLTNNTGEATKNFMQVIAKIIGPDSIDQAVAEGHKRLIEEIVNNNPPSFELADFLCGYKKMIKQERRKKDIAEKALNFLDNSAKPQNISEDWLEFFFDKARLITNDDMKLIWAKLLAEEANTPGKVSCSLLHSLSVMKYEQAEFFCNISGFAFRTYKKDNVSLLMFVSSNREVYKDFDITPRKLKEIERLGLIDCDFEKEYIFQDKISFVSGNHLLTVYGDTNNENKIKAGNVDFTEDGKVLYDIIDSAYKEYRKDIFDFTIYKLKLRNCQVYVNNKKV